MTDPQYPDGKLNDDDEGQAEIRVGEQDGKVIVAFEKPMRWIAMNPQEAADLSSLILKRAKQAARTTGEVITVRLG